jgi:hypothetical protein
MSDLEGSRSLLGHEQELAKQRWVQDSATYKTRIHTSIFVFVLLTLPLTIVFVLYLQWHSFKGVPETLVTEQPQVGGPERDLKSLLHPEDHVSRDPSIRNFSWNITKGTIAPNGVQKEVFLINGMMLHLFIDKTDNFRSISWPHDRGSVW